MNNKQNDRTSHLLTPENRRPERNPSFNSKREKAPEGKRTTSMLAANAELSQFTQEEWESLMHGEKFECQLLVQNGEMKEVILNVNLSGIRLLDPKNEEVMSQFDIEQILQYSYSQQNATFSFSYLEEGRFFVTHKFLSPDFFDIHQFLGNAIAIVIKLKAQLKKSDSLSQDSPKSEKYSKETLTKSDQTKNYFEKKYKRNSGVRKSEDGEGGEGESGEKSPDDGSQVAKKFADMFQPIDSKDSHSSKSQEQSKQNDEKPPLAKKEEPKKSQRGASEPDLHQQDPDKKKLNSRTIGSVRIRTFSFPEVVQQFDFKTLKKKKSVVQDHSLRNMSFFEINPEELPQTITRKNENDEPILIKTMQNGKYQITAGTIDALVECLADHNQPDSLYIDVFLQTYRNFLKPSELLEKLRKSSTSLRAFQENENNQMSKEAVEKKPVYIDLDQNSLNLVKLRIASVMKKWVERHWYDFEDPDMNSQLNEFLTTIKEMNTQFEGIVSQINAAIHGHKLKEEQGKNFPTPKNEHLPGVDLLECHPKDIAQQLTLVSVDLLKVIAPDEFVFYLWGKKNDSRIPKLTANLQKFIDRFNKIGYWVSTEICAQTDIKKRALMLEKFIAVSKYLLKYQNFNDLIAVLSGLNAIPIYRLKKTWAQVTPKVMTVFRELEAKMGPESNYKQYRNIEFEAKPPFIPFFGLYVKDLTFMNDGNQTYLPNQMINLEKHRNIMNSILAIRSSQQSIYNFEKIPLLLKYCEVIYNKEEEDLIEDSKVLEPSNRARRSSHSSINSQISTTTDASEFTDDLQSQDSNI